MARPTKYKITEMIEIIRKYTDETDIPVLKELCYQQDWNYNPVMKKQQGSDSLREAIQRLLCKKEFQLEKLALAGEINRTMAIFSLKQLGWSDRDKEKILLERERLELDKQKAAGAIDVELGDDDESIIDIDTFTKKKDRKCE